VPADRQHRYAIVIGIDRYPGFRDLGGACNDAEAFAEWLTDPNGGDVPAENVRTLLGRGTAALESVRPVKSDVDVAIHQLVETVRADRVPARLYLYFAGHGLAAGLGTGALLMADAQPGLCWNLSIRPYRDWLERCRDFSEVVVLCDCCRVVHLNVPEGMPPLETCPEPYPFPQRAFLAFAAGLGEAAWESEARGRFTTALLDGLGGAAVDAIGEVRADVLARFIEAELASSDPPQRVHAEVIGSPLTLASAGSRPGPPEIEIVIDVCAGPTRMVRVLGPGESVVASALRSPGPWTLRLALGLYELDDPRVPGTTLFKVEAAGRRVRFSA
jgi:hypothetical protein